LESYKTSCKKEIISSTVLFLQMPRGTRFRAGELAGRLAALDIDEGIRIENAGDKMFVNRNASGVFVVQHGSDFQYLESARQVVKTIKSRFGSKYSLWIY
jgi:hypothetical protein